MPQTNRHAIAEIVTRLLNHYPTSDEPLAVRAAIAQDWIDDLEAFSPAQINWATREWRQTQSLRPAIAEIRALAIRAERHDRERAEITDQRGALDADTLRLYAGAEYHGDARSALQRRQAAIDAQEERYARSAAFRAGKLDEYDAVHHPERLAERRRRTAVQSPCPISDVLAEMGITAQAAE